MSVRFEQICITTAKILNVLNDLKVHNSADVADKIEVSDRTVGRYIAALRSQGYPIKSIYNGEKRGICIDSNFVKNGFVNVSSFAYGQEDED